jgi:hypothetical protein
MPSSWSLRLLVVNLVFAVGLAGRSSQHWKDGQFNTLVTFGDSYTDENRLGYFINHNGSAPPVGWDQGIVRCLLDPNPCNHRANRQRISGFCHCFRRALLGAICQHILQGHTLQLRCIWCRMLQPDYPTSVCGHQCSISRYRRLRASRLPRRFQVSQAQWHQVLYGKARQHCLRHLDWHQRCRKRCLFD